MSIFFCKSVNNTARTTLGEYTSDDFAESMYVTLPRTADVLFNILFCWFLDVISIFQLCWSSKIVVLKISDAELQTQMFVWKQQIAWSKKFTMGFAFEWKIGISAPNWDCKAWSMYMYLGTKLVRNLWPIWINCPDNNKPFFRDLMSNIKHYTLLENNFR